jgi:hypothetical protein
LSLYDIVNVNMMRINNTNQLTLSPVDGSWNLEVTVFNVGLQCERNSEFFKVPPCTGPYAGYNFTIEASDGKNISVKTDSNGKFKTLLKPGSYTITAAPSMKRAIKDTHFTIHENNIKRLKLLTSDNLLE